MQEKNGFFYLSNVTCCKMKMQVTAWEKIFVNMYLTENLYLDYMKNTYDSTIEAEQPTFENGHYILPDT